MAELRPVSHRRAASTGLGFRVINLIPNLLPLTAFSLENIRNGRWLVGSTGRGITPYWQAVETVTPGKQLLFMQRVLFTFNIRKKQVRSLSTARCTAEQWELMLETSCLAHQLLEDMKAAKDDAGAALFREADIAKARQRALEGHRGCIVSSALRFKDDARLEQFGRLLNKRKLARALCPKDSGGILGLFRFRVFGGYRA